MNLLKNKITLVTGSNRGIGKAIVEAFVNEGAIVFANARKPGSLDMLAKQLNDLNLGKIIPLYFDVNDADLIKANIMKIRKEYGKLDVLVNNAGIMSNKLLNFITYEEMHQLFATNVFAVIQMMQYATKIMKENASIINISSIVGQRGNAGQILYSATKGAVISITKSSAKELAAKKIRVNSVAPGLTATDGLKSADSINIEKRIENIPFGRIAEPEDIAKVCVFLGSDLSGYVSGEIIGVNGSAIM